jgi:hypothetical protein
MTELSENKFRDTKRESLQNILNLVKFLQIRAKIQKKPPAYNVRILMPLVTMLSLQKKKNSRKTGV